MEASAPSERQMTSAALLSDHRIIEVIRAVSDWVSARPCAARVASRSAASQALTVDSVLVTWADRASPTRRFVLRSSSVNDAQAPVRSVIRRARAPAAAIGSGAGDGLETGDGLGEDQATSSGTATGAVP